MSENIQEVQQNTEQKQKGTLLQLVLFIGLSIIACVVQMLICNFGDDLITLMNADFSHKIVCTGTIFQQECGMFIAFLIGNTVAKLLSYFLNRKATFGARKNLAFSLTVYIIMCVLLIVAETAIGAPLAQALYKTALGPALDNSIGDGAGWCNILGIIIYSCADLIIVFVMNKFVIMNDNLFAKKEAKVEAAAEEVRSSEEEKAE